MSMEYKVTRDNIEDYVDINCMQDELYFRYKHLLEQENLREEETEYQESADIRDEFIEHLNAKVFDLCANYLCTAVNNKLEEVRPRTVADAVQEIRGDTSTIVNGSLVCGNLPTIIGGKSITTPNPSKWKSDNERVWRIVEEDVGNCIIWRIYGADVGSDLPLKEEIVFKKEDAIELMRELHTYDVEILHADGTRFNMKDGG